MDRREFLGKIFKRGGIAGGIAAVGAAGALGYYQPRKEIYREGEAVGADGLKERLEEPRKAVVVGGGLAGISAAMELARRNFDVTLVEASAEPGGKLKSAASARQAFLQSPLAPKRTQGSRT